MFRINGLNKNLLSIAWNGISFSPEKRAEAFNEDFEKTLSHFAERVNQQNITEEQKKNASTTGQTAFIVKLRSIWPRTAVASPQ